MLNFDAYNEECLEWGCACKGQRKREREREREGERAIERRCAEFSFLCMQGWARPLQPSERERKRERDKEREKKRERDKEKEGER